jgi:Tc5 transposase DNA-binding domain
LGVPKTTLIRRLKGGKSRSERQEANQLLAPQEEAALATWISASASVGNPVQHEFIREMAENLIKRRVQVTGGIVPHVSPTWVPSFLRRHRYHKTKMTKTPLTEPAPLESFYPTSSPPDPTTAHSINQAFFTEISNSNVTSPYKTQVRRLSDFMEHYQAEALIYKTELNEVKKINGRRKEREKGKRHVLKNTPVASSERVESALREHEEATNRKKEGKGEKKRTKKQAASTEDDIDIGVDDSSDVEELLDLEIFNLIEVT